MKDIVKDIERLQKWACIGEWNCEKCKYAVEAAYGTEWWCPFDEVIRAAADRAKEVENNDKPRMVNDIKHTGFSE